MVKVMYNQGVIDRSELSDNVIQWVENLYKRRFGEIAKVEYITWFEPEPLFIWDFGTDKYLETSMPKERFFKLLESV